MADITSVLAMDGVIGSIEPLPRFRLKPTGIGRARFIQQAFRVTEGSTVKYVWRAIEQVEDDAPDEVSSI